MVPATRSAAGRWLLLISSAQREAAPAAPGRVLPVVEPRGVVDDVLGRLDDPQQLDGCGGGADPDLQPPRLSTFDDLDRGILDLHVIGRHDTDHGDALGHEGGEPTFEPSPTRGSVGAFGWGSDSRQVSRVISVPVFGGFDLRR
jgi:hypothetical protein